MLFHVYALSREYEYLLKKRCQRGHKILLFEDTTTGNSAVWTIDELTRRVAGALLRLTLPLPYDFLMTPFSFILPPC